MGGTVGNSSVLLLASDTKRTKKSLGTNQIIRAPADSVKEDGRVAQIFQKSVRVRAYPG